jgi:predicted PurR-regulated permease PerM
MTDPQQKLATRTLVITLTVLATVLAAFFSLYFIYVVRTVVLDLVIALVLAAALQPLVAFLETKRLGKISATLIAIFAMLIVLGALASLIAAPLISEGTKLINNAPQILDQLTHTPKIAAFNGQYHLVDNLNNARDHILSSISGRGLPAFTIIAGIIGGITSVTVIIIFVFFILVDGPEAWKRLLHHFNEEHRKRIDATGRKMMHAISGFVSGNLFISLIAGTVALITLLIFRVPYAFTLAALVALLDLIPLIGTTLATIAVALVALTKGVLVAIIVVAILIAYQFTENHFIQPLVYSRYVQLSALLIIIATLVGAELAGVIGVLLAIPVAAVIQIAITDTFFSHRQPHP